MDKNWELPDFKVIELRPKKTRYCIGIPIINEGEKFMNQLVKMEKYATLADIIIFDGGSNDDSINTEFLKKNNVKALLVLKKGSGQSTQLRMGFSYALKKKYEGIITIDGNGKDGPEAIPAFINGLDEKYDLILGSRFIKGGHAENTPLIRYLSIRLVHAPILSLSAGKWYTDTTNGFRAYSRNYLLNSKVEPFRNIFKKYELYLYLTIRASQLGLRTKEVPISRVYPKGKIPTKIRGIKSNLELLLETIKTALGEYNP